VAAQAREEGRPAMMSRAKAAAVSCRCGAFANAVPDPEREARTLAINALRVGPDERLALNVALAKELFEREVDAIIADCRCLP
jgi:hypothetical protein